MSCDESRSQHKNKEILTQRFLTLMEKALEKPRKRIPTKVSKSVKLKRLSAKKKLGIKKSLRRKPKLD
jgi:ribosome-associated protein